MLDYETNKRALDLLGIKLLDALIEIFKSGPFYPHAARHIWEHEQIDEGLERNDKEADIAQSAGVSVRTVVRRKRNRIGI
jgi:hypothetical protein